MKRGIIHIILFLLVVFTIVHAAETSSSTINWLSRNSADRRYCLITGANCHLGGDGVGIWSIQGLFLSPNTTATGGIDDVNVTGTFCIGGECIADWSEVNGSSSDTNETPRVEALISRDANLTSVDCGGTDKVIGIQDNGTIICGADTIGGVGVNDGLFLNYTPIKTTGNITNGSLVGYPAANLICDHFYPNSHMCSAGEIINTINQNKSNQNFTATFRISEVAPGFTAEANDCAGWTSITGTALGSIFVGSITHPNTYGTGSLVACDTERAIGCCR